MISRHRAQLIPEFILVASQVKKDSVAWSVIIVIEKQQSSLKLNREISPNKCQVFVFKPPRH